MKIKFNKGIRTVHVPFQPQIGSYDQLFEQIEKIERPKSVRCIDATISVHLNLKGQGSYQLSEVSFSK